MALNYLLLDCKYNKITDIVVHGDSKLAIKGAQGLYRIEAENLKPMNLLTQYLAKSFDFI